MTFDPTDLSEDITPAAVLHSIKSGAYLRGILIAIRLGDQELIQQVLLCTSPGIVPSIVATVPSSAIVPIVKALGDILENGTPHIEHVLVWLNQICSRHGPILEQKSSEIQPVFRGIHKTLHRLQGYLGSICESNIYSLRYLIHSK